MNDSKVLQAFIKDLFEHDISYRDKVAYEMGNDTNALNSIEDDIRAIINGQEPLYMWKLEYPGGGF